MTINFTRQSFTESTARDILATRPNASRLEIAETAQRYLQEQYRTTFTPDPKRDHIANVVAFLRKHPASTKLAMSGPPLEDGALPDVTIEDA